MDVGGEGSTGVKGNQEGGEENGPVRKKEERGKEESSRRRGRGLHCDANAVTGKPAGAE